MRRFESCPHSQNAGVAFWLRAPLLQRGAVEFDPLPRHQRPEVTARLWPRGFRHRSSKAIHAGSSPARRFTPRSFSGRTKVFEAFYVGSIPALGAKLVLAWCTVHQRTYKPLRSRLERGRFDSQRQHHAFEAHEDEQPILNRQAVGSIPTGRTKSLELWPNGE